MAETDLTIIDAEFSSEVGASDDALCDKVIRSIQNDAEIFLMLCHPPFDRVIMLIPKNIGFRIYG